MPGLNIVINNNVQVASDDSIQKALQRCIYTPDYKTEIYPFFGNCWVSTVKYDRYPIRHFSDAQCDYFFEGRMFNLSEKQEEQKVREIFSTIQGNQVREDQMHALLGSVDSEFFLCVVDRSTRYLLLVGDSLSRLPVYGCRDENWTLYIRDLTLKQAFIPDKPDARGVAETMYFGYPLSDRTIFHGTSRLKPAFYILENAGKRTVSTWKQHNFEHYHDETNPRVAAEKAGELFLHACDTRLRPYKERVLSLSGGLDSRVIGSALNTLKLPFRVTSYLDPWNNASRDVKIAESLATIWEKQLTVVHTLDATEELSDKLLRIKVGMNSIGMAYILDFFIQISGPEMVYITGDGGDKVLPDITWDIQGKSIPQLASFILRKHTVVAPEIAAKASGTAFKQMRELLIELFEGYPEKSLTGKYTRFIFMERGVKWLFEGEDRNRYFFPSMTPFYSTPLFDYLMAIHPVVKRNYQLYRNFISIVSPETLLIENANWNFSIDNISQLNYLLFKQRVKYALPGWVKQFIGKDDQQEFNYIMKTLSLVFHGKANLDIHTPVRD